MIRPFQFAKLPRIYFRNGAITDLASHARLYGRTIVLVTGKNSFEKSPQAEKLYYDFEKSEIRYLKVIVQGEPSPDVVDQTVQMISNEDVKLVVGIGGGSVLDAGKAISAMLYKSEPVKYYLEGVGNNEHPGTKIPYIAVPTTSGTGSEATKNAVISQIGEDGFKRSLRHDNLVPDIALVDPELTYNCPSEITAASGMDCFTQLLEAYLSLRANEYTDALSLEGLKSIKTSLVRAYLNGEDKEARTGMSFAALTSGICLANAGLGAVHGFASSVGGMLNVPHGIVCGTLMAVANEINVRELRNAVNSSTYLKKYALLGELFLGEKSKSEDYYIDGFISYLHELTDTLNMPGLNRFGVDEQNILSICAVTDVKNNPVALSVENLSEILRSRLLNTYI